MSHTIRQCIAVAFLAGIGLSWPLWWGYGSFPTLPVADIQLPHLVDRTLVIALLIGLVGTGLSSRRIFPVAVISIAFLLLLVDQMRWQPWVYLYLLLLVSYATPSAEDVRRDYGRLIMAGVYAWSGIQKINVYFPDKTYRHILTSVFGYEYQSTDDLVRWLGYGPGIMEAGLGICLLFAASRRSAALGVVAMHIFVIGYLGYFGEYTRILIPWNVAMIALVLLLFVIPQSNHPGSNTAHEFSAFLNRLKSDWHRQVVMLLSIALVWILPVLSLFNKWDHFLSFSLFSDKASNFYVVVREDQAHRIPENIRQYHVELPGISGGQIIDVDWWARAETAVPFYPEERAFRTLARHVCGSGAEHGSLVFLEIRKVQDKPLISFTCE